MAERKVYSKTMCDYVELVDRDGIPGIRLLPGDGLSPALALHSEVVEVKHDSELSPRGTSSKSDIEEEDTFNHLKLEEESKRVLSKGQKKMLQENLQEMEKEDVAMRATLQRQNRPLRQPGRLLGCGVALLELFSGAATLTLMVASMGFPVAEPIDTLDNPNYDLLKPEVRKMGALRLRTPSCWQWHLFVDPGAHGRMSTWLKEAKQSGRFWKAEKPVFGGRTTSSRT